MEDIKRRKRILICDDDPKIRNAYELILKDIYDVTLAFDGEDAQDILALYDEYDLIFLDNTMPGIMGIDLLDIIHKKYPKIKVVMVSGNLEIKNDAIKRGALEFIPKPFSFQKILDITMRHIG